MSTRFRARVLSHDDPAFADCLAIRLRVFVDEQRFTVEDEIDGCGGRRLSGRVSRSESVGRLDEVTTHILLLDRLNNPVGTLRYFPAPKRKLGRLAVLPQFRKTGAATALLYALDEHVRRTDDTPSQRLEAHAQVGSLRFYDRSVSSPR
jgi:GNAT superfamily N-acetyltransferase